MEGAPVTAATGALGPVVTKLGALLGTQYKLRCRTRKDVKFIKSKLKSVHSILWAVWEKEILDAQSKELKKEALDLADDMHDAIDDFILTMEPSRRNKHLMIQIKIEASLFQGFRTRVDNVSGRCRSMWKIKSAERICSLFSTKRAESSTPSKPPPHRAPFPRKDASGIVGMGEWREDLITYLVGEEGSTKAQPQLKMASIVGMGGVGKTTLAQLVYEEIGDKFQSRAFVSVTPTPNMEDVLTSILQQLGAELPAGTKARAEEDIIHTISNFLEDKRYLVVIDDIWHHGEWEIISKSIPQNNLGSRIVMTSRIDSVSGDDFDNNKLCIRMNPGWIFEEERWFYGPHVQDFTTAWMKPDMVGEGFDCDHPIVRMCGCLPLALLCMFSAMSIVREQQEQLGVHLKARDVQDMIEKQVKQSGIQNTPGFEPLVECLQLGYDDLPHHMLKTCLLYCSIYPENYYFDMNDLVMRWVAEGFIYKEDAAKGYLEELCNRGLMLPGLSAVAYQMNHPMMRNFLRWKLREDNFFTCSSDITLAYSCQIHRLCIDDYPIDDGAAERVDPLSGLDWSQIRSLVVFEGAKRYIPFEKLEHVRVLDLQYHQQYLEFVKVRWEYYYAKFEFGMALGNHHVKDICGLIRVRHLFGLDGTGISEIPSEIARLRYLETLQVRFTWIMELPSEIGDLQQLKTLDVSYNKKLVELPREIGDLQHLETLDLRFSRPKRLPGEMWNLHNLENLNLQYTGLQELPREIGKLHHLKALRVASERITRLPSEIWDLQHLETLDLSYNQELKELPREIGKLQNLKRLLLCYTGVVKIPREIGRLKNLEILKLESNTIRALPWEASQLSKLEGVPECIRQAWKKSDLVSELAREILSVQMLRWVGHGGGLIVGTKHMHIPRWIKDHFNDLYTLHIRICKLEEQDLTILREMPNLHELTLRLEVVPRKPIAISGEGFPRLWELVVDSRSVPWFTFHGGAMPSLVSLCFKFQFYGGPPPPANKDPLAMGIKHLRDLCWVSFSCNKEWYGGAAESSPCMSAMIDVMRKEAQEHPNEIRFHVTGRTTEWLPANKSAQVPEATSSSGTGKIDKERD